MTAFFPALQKSRTITFQFTWTDFIVFWLVGGLSIAFLLATTLASTLLTQDVVYHASWWAFYIAFAVNNPHFAHSYQLFYKEFIGYMRDPEAGAVTKIRFFICGVVVPVALVGCFALSYVQQDAVLMGRMAWAMFFLVSWHYVKQGYGVFITLSARQKIYYENITKKVLLLNAYLIWVYVWFRSNSAPAEYKYYDVTYKMLEMPGWMKDAAFAALLLSSVLSAALLIREWVWKKKKICVNGVVGYLTGSYLWVIFPYSTPIYFLFVPMFHSLQYMPFVYWYKAGDAMQDGQAQAVESRPFYARPGVRIALFSLTGVALGAVFMYLLPKWIDGMHTGPEVLFSQSFFLVSFILFINIHHYFIDHAFWRRDNKKAQKFLFRRAAPSDPVAFPQRAAVPAG